MLWLDVVQWPCRGLSNKAASSWALLSPPQPASSLSFRIWSCCAQLEKTSTFRTQWTSISQNTVGQHATLVSYWCSMLVLSCSGKFCRRASTQYFFLPWEVNNQFKWQQTGLNLASPTHVWSSLWSWLLWLHQEILCTSSGSMLLEWSLWAYSSFS